MRILNVDLETRGLIDLTITGAHKYAWHPSTEIRIAAYAVREHVEEFEPSNVKVWRRWAGEEIPPDLLAALADPDTIIEAWNAQFERLMLTELAHRWCDGDPTTENQRILKALSVYERWHCTAARARACALPGKLELAARCLNVPMQKDGSGTRLINELSMPRPDGTFDEDPQKYEKFTAYCVQDVRAEGSVGSCIRDLTETEWTDYAVNERLNDRGIPVDVELARAAQHYAAAEAADIRKELSRITDGAIQTPKQHAKLKDWVVPRVSDYVRELLTTSDGKGGERYTLDKAARASILDDPDVSGSVSDEVLHVLELVDDAGRASTAKFQAIANREVEGRMFGCYIFNGGGQTGRYSASGFQPHNLPVRERISNVEDTIDLIKAKAPVEQVILKSGKNILTTLACLLRPTVVAEEGKVLVWNDYSSVEARGLPWLALDEAAKALIQMFFDGEDVYLQTAADIYGVPVDRLRELYESGDKDAWYKRQIGKVTCVAEGQLVLTPRGLVPIERIEKSDRVWDGVCWRSHEGVVFKGEKDVWEYQGLVATEDHIVFAQDGRTLPFGLCAREQIPLAKTGAGRQTLRLGHGDLTAGELVWRHGPTQAQTSTRAPTSAVPRLRHGEIREHAQFAEWQNERVPIVRAPTANSNVAIETIECCEAPLRKSTSARLRQLRRPRYSISVRERGGSWSVDHQASRIEEAPGNRSPRQQWSLCAREFALGDAQATGAQYSTDKDWRTTNVAQPVFDVHDKPNAASRPDSERSHGGGASGCYRETQELARYRGKARVYDIVNAGPLHRFTVSNVLVHNCLSLGFGGGGGALKKMARNYGIVLDEQLAELIKRAWRRSNPWAQRFWDRLHRAACNAVQSPGVAFEAGRVSYMMQGTTLWCLLPCGRIICYPEARITHVEGRFGPERVLSAIKGSWTPKKGSNYWPRHTLWHGILAENCLAWDTEVLTIQGWRRIVDVGRLPVWDGAEFVEHDGVAFKGMKPTGMVDGVRMTADHRVLTTEGWRCASEIEGHHRAAARLPDGTTASRVDQSWSARQLPDVVASMRLRTRKENVGFGVSSRQNKIVRLPYKEFDRPGASHAWHVSASSVRCMALHDRSLSFADASVMAQLRRSRHSRVPTLASVREFLGRYGTDVSYRSDVGASRQRQRIRADELSLVGSSDAGQQPTNEHAYRDTVGSVDSGAGVASLGHWSDNDPVSNSAGVADRASAAEAVYDIVNCGPRNRFVVRGENGPFIVHNCTQGICASLLRAAIRDLDAAGWPVIMHTHDEPLMEVDEDEREEALAAMSEAMLMDRGWNKGFPIAVESSHGYAYGKQ